MRCLGREGPTLAGVVAWQARRGPERLALTDGVERLTYDELQARVQEQVQAWQGTHPPGTLVGLEGGDGQVAFVVALLAGLRLGWRVVPLAPGPGEWGWRLPHHPLPHRWPVGEAGCRRVRDARSS
ncbi:hypothetical protein AUC44_08040 [Deinococcus actinosclerus]|uniref:AMP-dependent synthetase/ligase domain-containing protein n=1 Tax=Deinococcus actinosclerus TaxID=1768108 RepID=A0ABM5X599_9DEIO|nr:hypothetical protein AUC44_08040 [Deinococcus actinosclerus]